jgi:hypothetical protein
MNHKYQIPGIGFAAWPIHFCNPGSHPLQNTAIMITEQSKKKFNEDETRASHLNMTQILVAVILLPVMIVDNRSRSIRRIFKRLDLMVGSCTQLPHLDDLLNHFRNLSKSTHHFSLVPGGAKNLVVRRILRVVHRKEEIPLRARHFAPLLLTNL